MGSYTKLKAVPMPLELALEPSETEKSLSQLEKLLQKYGHISHPQLKQIAEGGTTKDLLIENIHADREAFASALLTLDPEGTKVISEIISSRRSASTINKETTETRIGVQNVIGFLRSDAYKNISREPLTRVPPFYHAVEILSRTLFEDMVEAGAFMMLYPSMRSNADTETTGRRKMPSKADENLAVVPIERTDPTLYITDLRGLGRETTNSTDPYRAGFSLTHSTEVGVHEAPLAQIRDEAFGRVIAGLKWGEALTPDPKEGRSKDVAVIKGRTVKATARLNTFDKNGTALTTDPFFIGEGSRVIATRAEYVSFFGEEEAANIPLALIEEGNSAQIIEWLIENYDVSHEIAQLTSPVAEDKLRNLVETFKAILRYLKVDLNQKYCFTEVDEKPQFALLRGFEKVTNMEGKCMLVTSSVTIDAGSKKTETVYIVLLNIENLMKALKIILESGVELRDIMWSPK